MIHFVLDDLRCPAGVGFDAGLQFQGLILDLDGLVAFAGVGAAEKGKATFFGVVGVVLFDDLGVEHYGVRGGAAAFVEKGDDALAHANHIRRHADTSVFVCHQRIKQVLCDLQIFFCRDLGLPGKENWVVH